MMRPAALLRRGFGGHPASLIGAMQILRSAQREAGWWARQHSSLQPDRYERPATFGRAKSFHLLQQLPRVTQQGLNLLSLGDRDLCEEAVLARVLVSPWRAGFRRTAVHAAAFFAAHRRRAARSAGADFCAATRARQHRTGIAGVIAHGCAPRLASTGSCCCSPGSGIGTIRASVTAGAAPLSETITLACCVTLPTMALPPSPTDTFCTVMAGSPWLRWRLSASIWAGNVRESLPKARAALSCWAMSLAFAR